MTPFDKALQSLKDADAEDVLDLRIIQQRVIAVFESLPTIPSRAEAQDEGAAGEPVEYELIERLLDAQQDINLAANETMSQSLADASALIDEIEPILRRSLSAAEALAALKAEGK